MIERNIVPDEVIYLKDDTENGEYLLKRWYHTNKEGMWRGKSGQQTNLQTLDTLTKKILQSFFFMQKVGALFDRGKTQLNRDVFFSRAS